MEGAPQPIEQAIFRSRRRYVLFQTAERQSLHILNIMTFVVSGSCTHGDVYLDGKVCVEVLRYAPIQRAVSPISVWKDSTDSSRDAMVKLYCCSRWVRITRYGSNALKTPCKGNALPNVLYLSLVITSLLAEQGMRMPNNSNDRQIRYPRLGRSNSSGKDAI
jgi:hypothetical protein